MKSIFLPIFLLAAPLLNAQELEQRAREFADLIAETDIPEKKYVKQLVGYFDPQTNADSTAQAHYDWWKRNQQEDSYPVSWNVIQVDYASETEGLVRTETYWHYPGGEIVRFVVQTQWERRGKKWYRSQKPQEILESTEMKVIEP